MLNRRLVMYFRMYKMWILVTIAIFALIIWAIVGMSKLESFYRTMMLAQMPFTMIMGIIHVSIFIFGYLYFLRGGFAKLEKTAIRGKNIDIKWKDVIGLDDAKQEAWEVVQLIRDRARLKAIGGKVIKGLLMIGPPGCGKTYLAKAIATEARLPFISMAGSEFTEIFVGVGASKVRKLFKKARSLAYGYGGCIVFIDELDAIGRTRQLSYGGGGQETNATQNQLLVALDGLKEKGGNVVVIGATNARESDLDKALLRPGRFDRKIYISPPGLEDREKIFQYYFSKVQTDEDINVGRLARRAVNKSPADIANIIMEAALITARKKKEKISMKEMSDSFERIDLGIKHKITMTAHEKKMTAYHESGHLITTFLLHPTEDVFKASIIPRRGTLGVVWTQPKEEFHTWSKHRLLAQIKVCLGGYIAEKVVFKTTTSGVASDFSQAMRLAHWMVWSWGMGGTDYIGDYYQIPHQQLSEEVKTGLNNDTKQIIKSCEKDVEELLGKERELLDRFAKELLEKEELEYDEIEAIFKEHGKTPVKEQKSPK